MSQPHDETSLLDPRAITGAAGEGSAASGVLAPRRRSAPFLPFDPLLTSGGEGSNVSSPRTPAYAALLFLRRRRSRMMVLYRIFICLIWRGFLDVRSLLDFSCVFSHALVLAGTRAPKLDRFTLTPHGPLLFEREFAELTAEGFRRRYRVTQPQFVELLRLCEAEGHWQRVKPVRPGRTHIVPQVWLAMVLDQLGRGLSGRTVSQRHGVCEGLFSRKRPHVLMSIITALQGYPPTRIGWPAKDDETAWVDLAREFVPSLDSRCAAFYGTVAAGDGTLIPIKLTHVSDEYRESFRSRKVRGFDRSGHFVQCGLGAVTGAGAARGRD